MLDLYLNISSWGGDANVNGIALISNFTCSSLVLIYTSHTHIHTNKYDTLFISLAYCWIFSLKASVRKLRPTGNNQAHHLFLYGLQLKKAFYTLRWLGKKHQKNIFVTHENYMKSTFQWPYINFIGTQPDPFVGTWLLFQYNGRVWVVYWNLMAHKVCNIHHLALERTCTDPCWKTCSDSKRALHLESRQSFSEKK